VLEPASIVMVYVPAGEFLMGSSDGDSHAEGDEKPQHTVYLAGYWIGRTEVTNAQFLMFIEAGGYSKQEYWTAEGWQWKESEGITQPRYWDEPTWNKPDHPVVAVSWFEAAAYAKWLGARLPTGAEWEKAARGTDGRIWPWGNEFHCEGGNLGDSRTGCSDGYEYTAPVGSYLAGASWCGALDMAGNVWEWVADWYSGDYYADSPDSNPTGPASGTIRTLRGGSWYDDRDDGRCAARWWDPVDRYYNVGFRVAQ
jgi:formylglycine-generating enzyme required for sulfatase activity